MVVLGGGNGEKRGQENKPHPTLSPRDRDEYLQYPHMCNSLSRKNEHQVLFTLTETRSGHSTFPMCCCSSTV